MMSLSQNFVLANIKLLGLCNKKLTMSRLGINSKSVCVSPASVMEVPWLEPLSVGASVNQTSPAGSQSQTASPQLIKSKCPSVVLKFVALPILFLIFRVSSSPIIESKASCLEYI